MRYYNPFEKTKKNQPTRDLEKIFEKLTDSEEIERSRIEKKRLEKKVFIKEELCL